MLLAFITVSSFCVTHTAFASSDIPTCAKHNEPDFDRVIIYPDEKSSKDVRYYRRGWYDLLDSPLTWFEFTKKEGKMQLMQYNYNNDWSLASETILVANTENIYTTHSANLFIQEHLPDTPIYRIQRQYVKTGFLGEDCSDDTLLLSEYTSSMKEINQISGQQSLSFNSSDTDVLSNFPVSLDGSGCFPSELSQTEKNFFNTEVIQHDFFISRNKKTQVHFIGHCHSKPALVFVDHLSSSGELIKQERYDIPASLTSFVEVDGTRGEYYNNIGGVSENGDTVAVNLIEHNDIGKRFLVGTLEVVVVKNDKLYRLPMQKTLNTSLTLSDARLSSDGNRIVIAHGVSIKLYEYDVLSESFVYKAKHSLESLYPDFYQEGSLDISKDGLAVSVQMQSGKFYQITFE